jgi:hypothetical protein
MELRLKPISREGISGAITKVELYRYLNEPGEAESICRDILAVDSENQAALRLLGLSITDQFRGHGSDRYTEAEAIFRRLSDDYKRLYYTGILHERQAKAQLSAGHMPHTLLPLFEEAMRYFELAEKIRPPGNDDAILRWNRCVRILQSRMGSDWTKELDALDASEGPPV